jgi:hypothetical protein
MRTEVRDRPTAPTDVPKPERMNDTEYLVFALTQSFKLFLSMAAKRWPHVR